MDKYITDLLELVKSRPDLPIVPMVDSETVGYDAYEAMTDEEALAAYRALPWVECIAVDINLP